MLKLKQLFANHSHYWGVPHPRALDDRLIQTCYGCGREREIKVELRSADKHICPVAHHRRLTA